MLDVVPPRVEYRLTPFGRSFTDLPKVDVRYQAPGKCLPAAAVGAEPSCRVLAEFRQPVLE